MKYALKDYLKKQKTETLKGFYMDKTNKMEVRKAVAEELALRKQAEFKP